MVVKYRQQNDDLFWPFPSYCQSIIKNQQIRSCQQLLLRHGLSSPLKPVIWQKFKKRNVEPNHELIILKYNYMKLKFPLMKRIKGMIITLIDIFTKQQKAVKQCTRPHGKFLENVVTRTWKNISRQNPSF